MKKQIFVTGCTGCIGHYVLDELKAKYPDAHFHLFARRPGRFKTDIPTWENITIHEFGLDDVDKLKDIMPQMDYIIHIATVWGYDLEKNIELNRDKTLEMFDYCDPNRLKRIIYFSTASILKEGNQLCSVARKDGIPYVQSKYEAYIAIKASKWADRVITLFPTVVLGGDEKRPHSHISTGFLNIHKAMRWLRWMNLNGAFHFLHAKDIAKVTVACLEAPEIDSDIVLGNPEMKFSDTLESICKVLNIKRWLKITISNSFILGVINIFRLKVDKWAKHCIKNPYFRYKVHSPEHFGLTVSYPSISDVLSEMYPS